MKRAGIPLKRLWEAIEASRDEEGREDRSRLAWPRSHWRQVWLILTPTQQQVLFFHAVQGQPLHVVADTIGCTRSAVDAAWRRACERIRSHAMTAQLDGAGSTGAGSGVEK